MQYLVQDLTLKYRPEQGYSAYSLGRVLAFTLLLCAAFYLYYGDQNIDVFSATAVPITGFFLLLFVEKLGKELPVKEIMVLLTAIQFLYSPFLAYFFYEPDPIYPMEVEPDEYFGYAVPGVLLFAVGLYVFRHPANLQYLSDELQRYNSATIGKLLVFAGLVAEFGGSFFPGSLAFFMLLMSYCKFIGAYYLYLSDERQKWWWILAAFSPLVLHNVSQGMFHELLLWGLFSIMIFFVKSSSTFWRKVFLITCCFVGVYYLNIIKKVYRDATWDTEVSYSLPDKLQIFGESVLNVVIGEDEKEEQANVFGEENLDEEQNLTRLNQGVIVTRIMNHTGIVEPFAEGETIQSAIDAALVPRILNPNKARSGGYDTYTRFTGYMLGENTSISLSLLGEGYANYGYSGIFFMFFLGLFYSFILWRISVYARKYPYLVLWIPFLFLTVIKAEEGFETVLNYLLKAALVLWALQQFFLKRYTRLRLDADSSEQQRLP